MTYFRGLLLLVSGRVSEYLDPQPAPNLNHTADLLITTDDGIQLAPFGVRNEVPAILIEGLQVRGTHASSKEMQRVTGPKFFSVFFLFKWHVV